MLKTKIKSEISHFEEKINTKYIYPLSFFILNVCIIRILWFFLEKKFSQSTSEWIIYEFLFILFSSTIILCSSTFFLSKIQKICHLKFQITAITTIFFLWIFHSDPKISEFSLSLLFGFLSEILYLSTITNFSLINKNIFINMNPYRIVWFSISLFFMIKLNYFEEQSYFRMDLKFFPLYFLFFSILSFQYQDDQKSDAPILKYIDTFGKIVISALAILVFFIYSFRPLINPYHTLFFLRPIDLMRNGNLPFWDTPSQYGILNIIIPAKIMTFFSTQTALHLWNSTLVFTYTCIVYVMSMKISKNPLAQIITAFAVFTVLQFYTGWMPTGDGPTAYPSVSGIRFLLPMLIVFSLFISHENKFISDKKKIFIGNFLWLLSCFWSAESLLYCTVIWIPTLAFIASKEEILHANKNHILGIFQFFLIRNFVKNFWIPLISLALIITILCFYYFFKIGYFPTFSMFFDASRVYHGGLGAYPPSPFETIIPVGFILSCTFFSLLNCFLQNQIEDFILLLASFLASFAVESYYVFRSHENNHLNLLPFFLVNIFILSKIWKKNKKNLPWIPCLVIVSISFISMNAIPYIAKTEIDPISRFLNLNPRPEYKKLDPIISDYLSTVELKTDTALAIFDNNDEIAETEINHYIELPQKIRALNGEVEIKLLPSSFFYFLDLLPKEKIDDYINHFILKNKPNAAVLAIHNYSGITLTETVSVLKNSLVLCSKKQIDPAWEILIFRAACTQGN